MGTVTRPVLSMKNDWYIPKHRFYELKHFCLQYHDYTKALDETVILKSINQIPNSRFHYGDKTKDTAFRRLYYQKKIDAIKEAAKRTDPVIGDYIMEAVVDGISYETLNARRMVPCCKSIYYDLWRKFFYILDKLRD